MLKDYGSIFQWEWNLEQPTLENNYLLKLNFHTTYNPAILFMPKRNSCTCTWKVMFNYAKTALSMTIKSWKTHKCPSIRECINKLQYVLYIRILKNRTNVYHNTLWIFPIKLAWKDYMHHYVLFRKLKTIIMKSVLFRILINAYMLIILHIKGCKGITNRRLRMRSF